ncbi:MIT domain protein [Opisthorchis viverrini]|uniref:MIT domain protein n=1 Tax=Opisthorchis viverrini TaxID=6198 RepID=A0A1S8WW50_OPIVI|nr:MIT domain protein [Opisthorchis viverrini]
MGEKTALQKGIELANEAAAKDKAGEYDEALSLYEYDVDNEQFLDAAPDPKIEATIRKKCSSYLTRAEYIKQQLKSKKPKEVGRDWDYIVCLPGTNIEARADVVSFTGTNQQQNLGQIC